MILDLYDLGFNLLPCLRRTKEPAIKWQSMQDARLSRAEIERWIPRTTNWAMLHGPVGGSCAIDPEGTATIAWLNPHIKDITTPVVRTGKSTATETRLHVYFRWQPDLPAWLRADGINPIKVQREAMYTMLPGSIHPDTGRTYELVHGSFAELAPLPASLLPFGTGAKTPGGYGAPFELPTAVYKDQRRPVMNQLIASLVTSSNSDQFETDGVLDVKALRRFVCDVVKMYNSNVCHPPFEWNQTTDWFKDHKVASFVERSFNGAVRLRGQRATFGPRLDDGPALDQGPELPL